MWIHVPSACCPSSPEPEGSTWPSPSLLRALSRSAMWRTKSLPPKSWSRVLKTAPSLRRLSGLTSAPSSLDAGVAQWISSWAAFPAWTSASPGAGKASKGKRRGSGSRWRESFATYDRASSSWRTRQHSLFEGLTAFSGSWPRRGTMRSGECFRRKEWEPPTSERESSSSRGGGDWPTPTASDYGSSQNGVNSDRPSAGTPSLSTLARRWDEQKPSKPGPQQIDAFGSSGMTTATAAMSRWPTATATDANGSGRVNYPGGAMRYGVTLTDALNHQWMTPVARDWKGEGRRAQLGTQVANQRWSTPRASESENRTTKHPPSALDGTHGRTLAGDAATWNGHSGHPSPETAPPGTSSNPDGLSSPRRRLLNPNFVEWLMGWPPGWTSLRGPIGSESPGMASCLWRQRFRSEFLRLTQGTTE